MSEVDKSTLVTVRDYMESDKNFVLSTFLRGLYHGDSWFSLIPKNIFMEKYHDIAEKLVAHPAVSVKVACLKDDPEVVLGYTMLSGDKILHWVFVKKAWRNIGIAKMLVPSTITTVTHLTKVGVSLLRKQPQIIFNPFIL